MCYVLLLPRPAIHINSLMRKLKITVHILKSKEDEQYLQSHVLDGTINEEQIVSLIERIKTGDKAALDRLIEGYTPYILLEAKRYVNQGLSLEELVNTGKEWLAIHCKTFSTDKFLRYGDWHIRQEILKKLEKGH